MNSLQLRLLITGIFIAVVILGLTFGEGQGKMGMMEKTREWLRGK